MNPLAAVLLLSACGAPPAHDYTLHGAMVYIHGHGPAKHEMKAHTDAWLDAIDEAGLLAAYSVADARAYMAHLNVHWVGPNHLGRKAGFLNGRSIWVEWKGCVARSAWTHELWHYLRRFMLNAPTDCKHKSSTWDIGAKADRSTAAEKVWCAQ